MRYPIGEIADSVAVGDVNGDSRSDVIVATGSAVGVFLQGPSGTLGKMVAHGSPYSTAVKTGDFNGDGRPDVGNIAVLVQLADGGFASPVPYSVGGPFTDAGGTLDPFSALPSWDVPGPVEIADLNGDSRAGVLVRHDGSSLVGAYLQNLDGTLAPEAFVNIPYTSWDKPDALALGDVDGDGFPDAVLAHQDQGLVILHRLPRYDVGITLTGPTTPVEPGATVTYTATVTNGGIEAMTDVQLVDALPSGMLFASSLARPDAREQRGGSAGRDGAALDLLRSGLGDRPRDRRRQRLLHFGVGAGPGSRRGSNIMLATVRERTRGIAPEGSCSPVGEETVRKARRLAIA